MIDHGFTRDLDRAELRALARELRARPDLWSQLVRSDPDERVYELLMRDEHVMAYLICWSDNQDTGFHDHDGSAGAVAVAAGAVREQRLRLTGPPLARTHHAGAVFDFDPRDIHRVSHERGEPAVTLHVYSPPLQRMGAHLVESDGTLTRQALPSVGDLPPPA